MNKYARIIVVAALLAIAYLTTLYILTTPDVKVFSGSTGTTVTRQFTTVKQN